MHSYPKVWHLGHKNVNGMFEGEVAVQEKYDGSQFSFEKSDGSGYIDEGTLIFKSNRRAFSPDDVDKIFAPTVEHLLEVKDRIVPGWVYRGEAFRGSRHNMKKYERCPEGNLVLFDIEVGHRVFKDAMGVTSQAIILGVENTAAFGIPKEEKLSAETLDLLLSTVSSLGGTKVEGIVFKNYDHQTPFGEPSFAKFVSPEFKEQHKKNLDWKQGKDLNHALGAQFAIEARWRKSVEHLRDSGKLDGSPKDIGLLLRELSVDLLAEYGDELKERVWKSAWKHIARAANAGFPEWYKRKLAVGEDREL